MTYPPGPDKRLSPLEKETMASKFKSSATAVPIDEAVGQVIAHDMTEIRPGQFMPFEEDVHGSYILNSKDLW